MVLLPDDQGNVQGSHMVLLPDDQGNVQGSQMVLLPDDQGAIDDILIHPATEHQIVNSE